MYIQQEKKRRPSVIRILFLTCLILLGLWFISNQPEWAKPFEPTPVPTRAAIYYENDGDILAAEGNIRQAIQAYEQAIALEPENDSAYRKQAQLHIFTGNTAKALTQAEQAVLLNPNSPENLAGYCQALDWEGHYGPAAAACECAIELDPDYAPGYAYLSEVYADQALWIAARTTAQEAIETNFQSPEAHHNMGYALEVQGRYKEAVEFYENAITLRPKLAPYYMAAGRNYYWLSDFSQAADRFGEAIKLDPTNPEGYDQLGWAYHSNGETARAIDALEQAISVDPTYARAWGRLGTIYYLRQNYEEALKLLPTAVELSENRFLSRARTVQILTQIEGPSGPEMAPVLQGHLEKGQEANQSNLLVANLQPVKWGQHTSAQQLGATCGDIIARSIQDNIIRTSPTEDITFSAPFTASQGTARLDIVTGELNLHLENIPFPENVPYEVQIHYRPDTIESAGYIQPDANNIIDTQIMLENRSDAPIEYYYELGLSYAYLSPDFCPQAIPWLLKALEQDSSVFNPAWAGLKICPTEDSPPTPLPTFTPTPEETTG